DPRRGVQRGPAVLPRLRAGVVCQESRREHAGAAGDRPAFARARARERDAPADAGVRRGVSVQGGGADARRAAVQGLVTTVGPSFPVELGVGRRVIGEIPAVLDRRFFDFANGGAWRRSSSARRYAGRTLRAKLSTGDVVSASAHLTPLSNRS